MAQNFPNSPTNGDTTVINGITYTYVSASSKWRATQVGGSGAGSGGSGTTTYATIAELPLTGNAAGDQAFVSGNNRLYIWNGAGWYNIALINTAPNITQGGAGSYDLAIDGTPTVITLTAADPEEVPITWTYSVTSGSLTNGGGATATVSQADNVFTITPTTTEAYAGTFSLTFTASDGVNIATDVNSFTLDFVTVIENSSYTAFLLQADASSSDNQVDASTNAATISKVDDPQSTGFSPYHPKGYSVYFDGSADYLTIPTNADLQPGSDDFTLECWVYVTDTDGSQTDSTLAGMWNFTGGRSWLLLVGGTGYSLDANNGTSVFSGSYDFLNKWTHIAWVKNGSTNTFYINGVSVTSGTLGTYDNSSDALAIGWNLDGAGASWFFEGYITDFRIVKGSAVYTSAFTPPTERLEAITNTSLLTCHLPYIADDSTNDYTVTKYGNTATQLFSPYEQSESYSKSSHGGSVYFDGSNDYLTVPASTNFAFGTGDFTIEFWIYMINENGSRIVTNRAPTTGANGTWSVNVGYTGLDFTEVISGEPGPSAVGLPSIQNRWAHIAVVRESGTTTLYRDGRSVDSGSQTTNFNNSSYALYIMSSPSENWSGGYLSDLRIVKGTAVYTADFTPPTEPLTAITNTQLLTCTNKHEIWDAATGRKLQIINSPEASTTQYKWSNSIYFDDTDAIYSDLDAHGGVGTRDYTWEAWVYSTDVSQEQALFSFGTYNPGLYIDTSSNIVHVDQGLGQQVNTAHGMSSNTWYHVAACRDGTNLRVFIDGTQVGSTGTGYNIDIPRDTLRIGAYETGATYRWNGYMEDVRLTIGLARYTSNFTPPTGSLEG